MTRTLTQGLVAFVATVASTLSCAAGQPVAATPAAPAASTGVTGFTYISSPGDYIGGGQTQTFLEPSASISVSGGGNHLGASVSDPGNWWSLDFASPSGSVIAVGSYPQALRYPFQSPMGNGLSMDGNGRGCNTLLGWFRVREYQVDSHGAIRKLAIDFLQNCEMTMPPLYGAFRYNSRYALVVPTMAAIAGMDTAAIEGQTVTLDGSQSFTRAHAPLTYRWTQVDGPVVALSDPTAVRPTFVAPAVPLAGASLDFQLTVTDAAGHTSTDDVVVAVQSASAPRTSFDFHGTPGDYISLGQTWHYDTHNATITSSRNYDGGLSAAINGDTWWYFDTAPEQGRAFKAGQYKGAQRFPFQSATAPGLSLDGDGRGCNMLTGKFTVYQIVFDTAGNTRTADIAFEQHCEGAAPYSTGELLINAVPHATIARQLAEARRLHPRQ